MTKKIRMIYPQWQGGMNPNYVFGAKLLQHIVPKGTESVFEIDVDTNFDNKLDTVFGIDKGNILLKQMNQVTQILENENPTHIITLGGDCSVSQRPFDYLSKLYKNELGILWLDAHPDISTPSDSSHLHEMVSANLIGLNQDNQITKVDYPISSERIFYAGLIEEKLRKKDSKIKELELQFSTPEQIYQNHDTLTKWIKDNQIKYIAVHWDLDVLSPQDYRSIYPAEPYLDSDCFPAAIGQLSLKNIESILNTISSNAEIVGLTLAEHLPWDAFNLNSVLSSILIFQ